MTSAECIEQERKRVLAIVEQRNEFVTDVDGYVYWWPSSQSQGHFAAHHLRWIADELDRRNKTWDEQVQRELARAVCRGTGKLS